MQSVLRALLMESNLLEATSAIERLDQSSPVEEIGGSSVVNDDLVATYRIRANHLQALQGEHWQRLSASTSELANNLMSHTGRRGGWFRIGSPNEPHFAVFVTESPRVVIGCMWVVPADKSSTLAT